MALLSGVRVLDLVDERGLMAGRMLADLGADVVLVEPPGGSPARWHDAARTDVSYVWEAFAANRRSLEADLDTETGRALVGRLVGAADILVTSLDPPRLAAVGLDWDSLALEHPGLVYVQITAFGLDGPKASYASSDLVIWAASGALHPNRHGTRPPVRVSSEQAYLHAGADAAVGALLAYRQRQRGGGGQRVQVSAQISSAMATICRVLAHAVHDHAPGWEFEQKAVDLSGSGAATPPELKKWACLDGFVEMNLGVGPAAGAFTNRFADWMREEGALPDDLARVDWSESSGGVEDSRLPNAAGTTVTDEARARLRESVRAFLAGKTKEQANEAAVTRRLSCSGVRDARDVADSAQLAAREFWIEVGEGASRRRLPGPFAHTDVPAFCYRGPAPAPGAHTHEVAEDWQPRSRSDGPGRSGNPEPPALPLEGLKVVDFSWVFAGPMVSRVLADFGATVVHAESATRLDTARRMKPYHDGLADPDRAVVFGNANAGKLGIALDMGRPEARAVAADLCHWADVVIESYSPGVMARWGLDYATLRSERPELIMVSSCLNGQTGPAARLAGFGNTGAALAGFTHLGGWPDAVPIGPFGPYTDYLAPRLALSTLLGALEARDRTGVGCYVDVSQVEGGVYFLAAEMAEYFSTGRVAERLGNASRHHGPHGVYPCQQEKGIDRFLAIAVTDDCQWDALARLLGLAASTGPGADAPVPFATVSERLAHRDEIDQAVAAWCRGQRVAEAETTLQALMIPAHRSANSEDFVTDPQLAHLGHLVRLPHAKVGETTVEGPRYRLEATPGRVERAAPLLGEHNVTVLRDLLGYPQAQIETLVTCGALQ